MAHFEIKNLCFSYPAARGNESLNNVCLSIEKGEYVVLCGKSGSGKTTLLRHLKPVLSPHGKKSGSIFFNGVPMEAVSQQDQAAKIGYVMQNPDDQIVTDKVWHELAFGLESLGCDQKTMRARVAEMACYFGIQDWFHRDVVNLSGGQKQLLNLASIMAMQPEVLILDEPTSQLDPIAASHPFGTADRWGIVALSLHQISAVECRRLNFHKYLVGLYHGIGYVIPSETSVIVYKYCLHIKTSFQLYSLPVKQNSDREILPLRKSCKYFLCICGRADLTDQVLKIQTLALDQIQDGLQVVLIRPQSCRGLVFRTRHRMCTDERNPPSVHLRIIVDLKLGVPSTAEQGNSAHSLHTVKRLNKTDAKSNC